MLAVGFLIEVSLVDFESEGRVAIKSYRPPSRFGSWQSVPVPPCISAQSD